MITFEQMKDERSLVSFWGMRVRYQSLIPVELEMFQDDISLSYATGFFMHQDKKPWLITNWHVLAGRNNETGQPLHSKACVPNHLAVEVHNVDCSKASTGKSIGRTRMVIPLERADQPIWKCHQLGQLVDIAAIQIRNLPERCVVAPIAYHEGPQLHQLLPANEIFIVGYPAGITANGDLPIWKRGTIAAEPLSRVDTVSGKISGGVMLCDAQTRHGLSGAPVFHIQRGAPISKGKAITGFLPGEVVPIGVYSGRLGANDRFEAEVGRIWPLGFVDEVITKGKRGGEYTLLK